MAPALAATLITGTVVGAAVAVNDASPQHAAAGQISRHVTESPADRLADRDSQRVSRAARRVTLEERPEPVGHRFTTVALNVRTEPTEKSKVVTVLDLASKVAITGETKNGFAEIVRDRKPFWVSAEFLAKKKPEPEPEADSGETSGTAVATGGTCTATPPSGVTSAAMAVFNAVCPTFPSITTYGGWRGDGEHADGRAIDIMVSGDLGWQVANYLRANASEFGLYDIIYAQRIWTAERSSEGWRPMSDRGSATANHYDHVHVKVY